jgi:starch synthase (maltosyl-transferring)
MMRKEVLEGRKRVVIEKVTPEIDCGRFSIKRVVGEKVVVEADIYADGHDTIAARLLNRAQDGEWAETPMTLTSNDRWRGEFIVEDTQMYFYTVEGWVDRFETWKKDVKKKFDAGQDIKVDLLYGIDLIKAASKRAPVKDKEGFRRLIESVENERDRGKAFSLACDESAVALMNRYPDRSFAGRYEKELPIVVDRKKAVFSAWYELFPRSCAAQPEMHGTFRDCESLLPAIAEMGFDVLYFPPIHPIGKTNRKGRNNLPSTDHGDAGSPWAIGSEKGGHKEIDPTLGTMDDFKHFITKAEELGMDVAIDLALQCSPDHPYVKDHPEWFRKRPDGTIQYAENPPKKYEDIVPLNFETEKWKELWEEMKDIVLFWINQGIRVFRVDNPHTKPFLFWQLLIGEVKEQYPEVIFLSEAFTRPKVMYRLAKAGFTQSYTYFTWRNTKSEFTEYLTELTRTEVGEYFRPNFWPNTPDILPEHLQYGGRPAFIMRFVLAATLSSNYGIYGPPFELCVNEALQGKEEYLDSEKYEVKQWERDRSGNLRDFISRVNRIRRENPALQTTVNLKLYQVDNDYLLFYGKATADLSNILLMVVNLDPYHTQSGFVHVPLAELGIDPKQPYLVHEMLSDDKYIWQGEENYVELNPHILPAYIFRVRKRLKRETDFDYFM